MAENRIDSLYDYAALEIEAGKVEKKLSEIATTIKTFPKAQVFYDASGLKDLSSANKELSTVLSQLKVKNLELTNSIKEQQLAEKTLAVQRKQAIADAKEKAAAEKEVTSTVKTQTISKRDQAAAEKALSAQQVIAGRERIIALRKQAEMEQELEDAIKRKNDEAKKVEIGSFDIQQGSGQSGTPGLVGKTKEAVTKNVSFNTDEQQESLLFLVDREAALKKNKAAQKDLDNQLEKGIIGQAKYNEQIAAAKGEELDLRKQISLTTAELKARTNANFAIQGSIDEARAQNALLIQQRNSVPVGEGATEEDVIMLKELNAEIDKNNALIDKNNDLLGRQKINIGNYPTALGQTFKTLNTELEQVQGKLVNGNFGGKEFDQLTAKQAVLQNALSLTGKTYKSSAAEATAYKEAAVQIGQVYGKDSSIFKQFAEGVKTGAANTKALANEVAGVATKGRGFMGFLSAAYGGIRKLAYAIPGLGIGGIILLLLGPLQAAGATFVKWAQDSTKAVGDLSKRIVDYAANLKAMNEVNANANKEAGKQISTLKLLYQAAADVNLPMKERLQAVRDLKKEFPDYFGQLNTEKILNGEVKQTYDDLTQSIIASSRAKAAKDKIDIIESQKLDIEQQKLKVLVATTNEYNKSNEIKLKGTTFGLSQVSSGGLAPTPQGSTAVKTLSQNIKEITDRRDKALTDLDKQNKKLQDTEDFLIKFAGIGNITESITKADEGKVKKSREDSERLLDEFRKKTLKEQQEYLKALDEAELKQYKLMADDQNLSLTERLDFEKKYYEKSLQMAKQNVQDQVDAVNLESNIANKKAGEIKDAKKRADTLTEIEDYRVTAIKRISEEGNAATLKINRDFYDENVQIATQSYDKINKIAQESAKFRQDQEKIALQNKKDQVDIDKDNQLLQLDKDFKNGKIKNLEEYNQRKDDIETAADIKQKQLDLKRIQDAERIIEAIYGVKNLNLIKQAKDLEVEIEEAGNRKILNDRKRLNDNLAELRDQLEQTFQDVVEGGFDARQQKNEAETKAIQDKSQKEIDAINASGLAEEEKTRRVTAIQKQADFQTQQIEKRQQQQDIARAKFERVMSIAKIVQNTAIAISKAIAESPLTFGMPWTAIDAALGAAQIASILAQPLPRFKEGTKSAPRGKAIVGEEGSELIVDKAGRMFVTPPQPTLIELAGGEQVFKHDVTKDFLMHHNLLTIMQKAESKKQPVKIDEDLARRTLRVLQNIERKQGITIINNVPIESTAYYNKNIKN